MKTRGLFKKCIVLIIIQAENTIVEYVIKNVLESQRKIQTNFAMYLALHKSFEL